VVFGTCQLSLCGDSVKLGGETFTPDEFTAFMEVELSHSLPVITAYGIAILPAVIASSFRSMLYKQVNIDHLVKAYNPTLIPRDRVIGTVVAVEFAKTPEEGWTIPKTRAAAPGIRAIIAIGKKLEGVDRIIGQHQSGKKKRTVSMEVFYSIDEAWFAWKPGRGTPAVDESKEIGEGWRAVPFNSAPKDMLALWSSEKVSITGKWNDTAIVLLMGGIDGEVIYAGIGIVQDGAEDEAEICRLLASHPEADSIREDDKSVASAFLAIAGEMQKISENAKLAIDCSGGL